MDSMVKCLRALGDENRLRILMLLRKRELCVLEVVGVRGQEGGACHDGA